MESQSTVLRVFTCCARAIRKHKLIRRESAKDKEFHFQNWVGSRLTETKFHYETGGT